MSPPLRRQPHRRPAAPDHPFFKDRDDPHKQIIHGLRRLGKSMDEILALLHPSPTPAYRSVKINYPGFEDWINDQVKAERETLYRAIPKALHDYEKNRDKYIKDVRQLLKYPHYRSAKAVVDEIATSDRVVVIIPYRSSDEHDRNADVDPARPDDATPLGMTVLDDWGEGVKMQGATQIGTGRGSDAKLDFSPNMWTDRYRGPGTKPDEVLLHELIHASRIVKDVSRSPYIDHGYLNEEELVAIMIGNIYLSEKNQTELRGNHNLGRKTGNTKTLEHPEKFLDNFQHLNMSPHRSVELLRMRQPRLYAALSAIGPGRGPGRANFNPIRDWERLRKKVLIDL
jgi:hypothetical protein